MMKRFGLYKCLPIGRLKVIQPIARLVPNRFIHYIPPMKVGSVEMMIPDEATLGEVWVSPAEVRTKHILPRALYQSEVVGIEGWPIPPGPTSNKPVFTNGNALELINYLEGFLNKKKQSRRSAKIRVAIGGGDPRQVSTVARLLSREIDELLLIGEEPYLWRLAGQILAETGLAVRIRPFLPDEHFERVISCGETSFRGRSHDRLFSLQSSSPDDELFPWRLQGSSEQALQEVQSLAAAEAVLMILGGWDRSKVTPGLLSVAWVEHIGKIAKDIGFRLPLEALDTPPPVGYNVNNL
jgi:hypothetical protein